MTDLQARIPESIQQFLRDGLDIGRYLPAIKEKKVDVGVGIQFSSAVSALRDESAARIETGVPPNIVPTR
jgi:hypothetical protein